MAINQAPNEKPKPPEVFQLFDIARPEWLDLMIIRFIKIKLFEVVKHFMAKDIEGVGWEHPWMRYYQEIPWQPGELPSTMAFREVHDWMHKAKGAGLGHSYWDYSFFSALEYVTWGTGIERLEDGGTKVILHERYGEDLKRLSEAQRLDLVNRLSSPFVLGIEESEPIAAPTGSRADLVISDELNRLRRLINPFLKNDWGQVVAIFWPYELHPAPGWPHFPITLGFQFTPEMAKRIQTGPPISYLEFVESFNDRLSDPYEWVAVMQPFKLRSGDLVARSGPTPILAGLPRQSTPETIGEEKSADDATIRPLRQGKEPSPEPPKAIEPVFIHSEDYRSIQLRGECFTLTINQAEVIRLLHASWIMGIPDVSLGRVKDVLGIPDRSRKAFRLINTFKRYEETYRQLIQIPRAGFVRLKI